MRQVLLRLTSVFLDLRASFMGPVGCLLAYALKHRLLDPLAQADSPITLEAVRRMPTNTMSIDRATLNGLHVFLEETPMVVAGPSNLPADVHHVHYAS